MEALRATFIKGGSLFWRSPLFRLAIFIDGGYLDKVLRHEQSGAKISFDRFACGISDMVRSDIDLLRTYYYHCLPWQDNPPTEEQSERFGNMRKFLSTIDRLPRFEVRTGRIARRREGSSWRYEQKGVDVLMSVDLVKLSVGDHITHAVLVTGDSDFVPAVKEAKHAGVSVWLLHGDRPHNELWAICDERIQITPELIDKVRWVEYQND